MGMNDYDFSGWATKNDLRCSDGRVIKKDAFKHNDGQIVPLVWNHQHAGAENVLGHALLKNMSDGVYAYGKFNETEQGLNAKMLVQHGDIVSLSIFANRLKQNGPNVMHGDIKELSLVLAGANPGALIDNVIAHGEESNEEAIIYTGENISLDEPDLRHEDKIEEPKKEEKEVENEKTVKDILDSMTEEQRNVCYAMVGQALESKEDDNEEGGEEMKHNIFDQDEREEEGVLSHSELETIIADAKRYGSMKDSFLQHGIENIDYLFPEAKNLNMPPEFIKRDTGWVAKFMNDVRKSPFSRIKSMFANITEDEARAKGYIKGKLKKDEVFSLLKRTTTPTTVYKKQKLDRDDVVDITDIDVIAWIKGEMRMMLDEEIARAALVGDGRLSSSDDKINETNIRPIWTDEDLFTIKGAIDAKSTDGADVIAKAFIKGCVKNRKNYKGSGEPTLFTTEDILTDCLLLEDMNGRVIYDTVEKLAKALRVKEIVTVPVMEGLTRTATDGKKFNLLGIIVNLKDYNIGADKGGAVNMFDDFDIDYNAMKYLIETRCSGALIKPYSAMAIELPVVAAEG